MKLRLLILIALAGGLAIYLAVRPDGISAPAAEPPPWIEAKDISRENTVINWVPIGERPLPGVEAPEPAEFDVRIEVDPRGKKSRLFYYITEKHGYYVEAPQLLIWHVAEPGLGLEDTDLDIRHLINDYIPANETYKGCVDVVPAELANVASDIGTDENWAARVESWGRTRVRNPEPLPVMIHAMRCD